MYNIGVSSPTVADDMTLVSFSEKGMNAMLEMCDKYSKRWRYEYNASKCAVMVCNETTKKSRDRIFQLGEHIIVETHQYTHLGLVCDPFMSCTINVDKACTKLRGSILSLKSNGINPTTINPLTMKTIYNSVVIPKGLYGCELWSCLSSSDILKLERSHRFCVKYAQSFSQNMNTDFSLNAFGSVPIEHLIDYRKLSFWGQLCRLANRYLAKQMFTHRLVRFLHFDRQTKGFIPDGYKLLCKYGLCYILDNYVESGQFPSPSVWKNMLQKCIFLPAQRRLYSRLCERASEALVMRTCSEMGPSDIWLIARETPYLARSCKAIMYHYGKFISQSYYIQCCDFCGALCTDRTAHRLCFCTHLQDKRSALWNKFIELYGNAAFVELSKKLPFIQCREFFKAAILIENGQTFITGPICKLITDMLN